MEANKEYQRGEDESVESDTTVADAARLMLRQRQRGLKVRSKGRVVGTLSLHDLVVRTTAEGRDPKRTLVRELMNPLEPGRRMGRPARGRLNKKKL